MPWNPPRRARAFGALAALASALAACGDKSTTNITVVPRVTTTRFLVTNLVADTAGFGATFIDTLLVNPWGIAFAPTGLLWSANNATSTSTIYNAAGARQPLVVGIPSAIVGTGGSPTGLVLNTTTSFVIPASTAASFIFAGEDGTISAWNTTTSSNAVIVADRSAANAVYKGIAIGAAGGTNFLYATDFRNARIDVFNANFQYVRSFTDPSIPGGYAPFGIHAISGRLYVTFAKQQGPTNEDDAPGPGNGYVVIFNGDGTFAARFASRGTLNSPWAVVQAPAGFADLGGAILVGNFGDGRINAYNAITGAFIGQVLDTNDVPITLAGLWGLAFGPSANTPTLYFSSGPGEETHGLLGTITPRPVP